jgi:hypothetical protein
MNLLLTFAVTLSALSVPLAAAEGQSAEAEGPLPADAGGVTPLPRVCYVMYPSPTVWVSDQCY